jgi:hypothetical protein
MRGRNLKEPTSHPALIIEQAFENGFESAGDALLVHASIDRACDGNTSTLLRIAHNEEGYSLWRTKD